ncbi:MAG: radical SAM protein [Candidatus Zixiibacteriota bacterium]|nr:MAG: radical SAM protein [candidate division Zixibacteria bacterium]
MARLLFVHDSQFEYPGVLSLCGYLPARGHEVEVLIRSAEGQAFWDKAKDFKPDWVGFSSIAGLHHENYRLAGEVKERLGVGTIFGGPYVSYFPQAIQHEEVDVIIRGEAEEALADFLDAHDRGEDYLHIPNLVTKRNGEIISNPLRPLEPNLDKYPIADRHFYYKYPTLRDSYHKQFMSGRGCPHNCYFCFNQEFRKMYNLKGKEILRRNSPERVIEELVRCKNSFPTRRVIFNDDIFIYDVEWLEKFLPMYQKEVGIPFGCQARINMMKERVAQLLGRYGCHHVMMGLESGNPRVRNIIMGKGVTNEQFLKAVDMLHRNGVKVTAYNILGCPSETLEEALDTVRLNAQAKVDYPWHAIYQPHPGTQTEAIARQMGYLEADFTIDSMGKSVFRSSRLNQPEIKEVIRVQKLFYLGVKFPWFIPVIRKLAHVNLDPLYNVIFIGTYFIRYLRESGNGFFHAVWIGIRNIKNY